jgi:hypothetical protein
MRLFGGGSQQRVTQGKARAAVRPAALIVAGCNGAHFLFIAMQRASSSHTAIVVQACRVAYIAEIETFDTAGFRTAAFAITAGDARALFLAMTVPGLRLLGLRLGHSNLTYAGVM